MARPKLLDLFCGAGGAAMGYHRVGFDVTGVDLTPQPRYPFGFVQGDALAYVAAHGHEYDAIHASPPCQGYSVTRSLYAGNHTYMIPATRAALVAAGKPYAIENVEGARAAMRYPIMLCGTMFGLKVYRHRLFELSTFVLALLHPRHTEKVLNRRWCADWGGFVTVAGGMNASKARCAAAMGIDWMTKAELAQSIPPAYTEWIGARLLGEAVRHG